MNVKTKKVSAPLFISQFGIAPKYEIVTDEGKRIIQIPLEVLEKEDFDKPTQFKYYSPSDYPHIYSQLAPVNDEKSLLKFTHRFGLLGISKRNMIPVNLIGVSPDIYNSASEDSVTELLEAARKIRDVFSHWVAFIREGKIIKRDFTWSYIEEIYPEYIETLKDADDITLTKAYLAIRVSRHLGGTRPVANFTKEGQLVPGFTYLSLYDAIWHQLYIDMTSYVKFKQCPWCKSWHTGRGRFCPAPPFYNRSACENSWNHSARKPKKEV